MTANRLLLLIVPMALMLGAIFGLTGIGHGLAGLGKTEAQRLLFARAGLAMPYIAAAGIGVIFLFATASSASIRAAAWSVVAGCVSAISIALAREAMRLSGAPETIVPGRSAVAQIDPATMVAASVVLMGGIFALRVAVKGNAAFAAPDPKRVRGRRALHGDADWMSMPEAARLFGNAGGIVVGERYRVDRDSAAAQPFRTTDRQSWGFGGRPPLLCFDASFGSSHGIVFAGSGGFKTTSVTVPTALKWGGALVVLDPSNEVAPMVIAHRRAAGRTVQVLDPHAGQRTTQGRPPEAAQEATNLPRTGFNALDWIGRFGGTKEEDIAAVASWIMSDSGGARGVRDDFFRASALQLLTALIADVCLSGHTEDKNQTLRQVRANLSEPEPKLRARLQAIYDNSESAFVKENVAVFVNMTPETFSGVYANAVKETHWLSYPNYAALVSGSTFVSDDLAGGQTDVFINLDLKTLETHAGLARVIIGSFMNAIYKPQRRGDGTGFVPARRGGTPRLHAHPGDRPRRRPQIRHHAPPVVPVDRSDARNLWRPRRGKQMVRERELDRLRGRERPGNRRLHLKALRHDHGRDRPGQPLLAGVRFVADAIETAGLAAADPAARSAAHARRRADRVHRRQRTIAVRPRHLVPARRYEGLRRSQPIPTGTKSMTALRFLVVGANCDPGDRHRCPLAAFAGYAGAIRDHHFGHPAGSAERYAEGPFHALRRADPRELRRRR